MITEPNIDGRDLPPEAIRNIKRRYRRICWLAYGLLILVLADLVSGNTATGASLVAVAIALVICVTAWYYSHRAIWLARFGEIIEGKILAVHSHRGIRKLVDLHGLVGVVIEYQVGDKHFRWKKSMHMALRPQVGAVIQVVVDPRVPRRTMLLFDLRARLVKS